MTRDDKGAYLYRCLNRDTVTIPWADLPDNRKERYRIAAEDFAAWLESHRVGMVA